MSQSVSFLPETQKRIFKNVIYVGFEHKNPPKCHLFEILQLAPSVPVLLLEHLAIKLYESFWNRNRIWKAAWSSQDHQGSIK